MNQPTFSLPVPPESDLRTFFNEQFELLKSDLKRMNIKSLKETKTQVVIGEPSFEVE